MPPAERAFVKRSMAMTVELMNKQISMVALVNRPYSDKDAKWGDTISMRIPQRFRK